MIDVFGIIGKAIPVVKAIADTVSDLDSDRNEVVVDNTPDTVNITINLNLYGDSNTARDVAQLPENLVARMVPGMRYDV